MLSFHGHAVQSLSYSKDDRLLLSIGVHSPLLQIPVPHSSILHTLIPMYRKLSGWESGHLGYVGLFSPRRHFFISCHSCTRLGSLYRVRVCHSRGLGRSRRSQLLDGRRGHGRKKVPVKGETLHGLNIKLRKICISDICYVMLL